MADEVTKKPRSDKGTKRRDYQREMEELEMYVDVSIGVLTSIVKAEVGTAILPAQFMDGQLAALKAVQLRLKR